MDTPNLKSRTERLNFIMKCIPESGVGIPPLIKDIIYFFDCEESKAKEYVQSLMLTNRVVLLNFKVYPNHVRQKDKTLVEK
jgi:hypothetical protein